MPGTSDPTDTSHAPDSPTRSYIPPHRHPQRLHFPHPGSLEASIQELATELAGFRQEVRSLRESVRELRDQVAEQRRQAEAKGEQVTILRTQFRVLWAVAGTAGASALGALVLELLRLAHGVGT
jgi:hypothetical protein